MPATKTRPKILSVVLTVALLFGSVPVTAFAESPSPGIGGEIVGFGDYEKAISVSVGTPEEEARTSLPPHLPAKVIPHLQTVPPTDANDAMDSPNENSGNTEDGSADLPGENGDAAEDAAADPLDGNDDAAEDAAADPLNGNDDDDDGEEDNAVDSLDEIDASIPVTWQTAAYNADEPGEYIFTAEIPSEYTLADGVGMPKITVTVTADELPGVVLSDSRIKLAVGDTYTLTYSLPPDTPESSGVEWLTSDASVATVQEGLVTAAAEGSTEITAQLAGGGDSAAVCFVEVSATGELKAITVFETPDAIIQYQSVEPGTKKESLVLPDKLIGTVDGEAGVEIPGVTWECAAYSEEAGMIVYTDPETGLAVSEYVWKPVLPEGYKLADDTVELPSIHAMLPAEAGVMATADWRAAGPPILASGDHTVTIYPDAKGTLEVPPSSEITIVGSTDWIQGAGPIAINIPETSSVTWQAMYWGTGSPLLNLQGAGDFTVGPGGAINNRGSGNAIIIDGSGMNVTVSGGSGSGEEATVAAVTGTAIESQGTGNTVTVEGNSTVGNESASNIRPIINMSNSGDTDDNVFIHGGRVWTIGRLDHPDDPYTYAYAIQTYGNVVMTGGDVWSGGKNGRAINLVGTDSTATISGGTVRADGASGVAISTATTMISGVPAVDAVANSKVIIEGDAVVTSAGNYAIHTTGKASQVTIRGNAWVSTGGNGDAIYAENAAGSIVTVESGVVSAQNGYAIRTATNGQVEVSGGFVFAYGDSADGTGNSVINKRNFAATDDGIVAAWNQGSNIYIDGTNNDLDFQPAGAVLTWVIPNLIHYGYGGNEGDFALPVTVIRPGHGLVFDNTKTGSDRLLYLDLDSSGTVTDIDEECEGQGTTWNLASDGFELNNFQWSSESPAALIVIGDTVITVSGNNNLASYFYDADRGTADEAYYGVYSDSSDITIDGGGFLTAVAMTEATDSPAGKSVALYGIKTGGTVTLQNGFLSAGGLTVTPGDTSFGISGGSVAILGGGIEAQGFTKAFELGQHPLMHWEKRPTAARNTAICWRPSPPLPVPDIPLAAGLTAGQAVARIYTGNERN